MENLFNASILKDEWKSYLLGSKENWSEEIGSPYFDEPLIQFASADDPLFLEYKTIIGPDHLTPREVFELKFGPGSYRGGSVISIALPVHQRIRASNREQREHASKEWAHLRAYGDETFLKSYLRHLESDLNERGHRTVAPVLSDWFKIHGSDQGPTSNWSERHVAFAAGLGTFSLNDGFITEKGIAVRFMSVVTELPLAADTRHAHGHTDNCLLCSKGTCGVCITRCPVNAISQAGHDKMKCLKFVYGDDSRTLAVSYGGNAKTGAGCGLCQTKVPCESRNPLRTGRP